MNHKFCASLVCLLLLFTVGSTAQTRRRLSEAEIIQKAEMFIVEQGYTDSPPTQDKSKLRGAFDEGTDDLSVQMRRGTLLREAHGVIMGKSRNPSWIVVFRYNPESKRYLGGVPDYAERTKKVGRAVMMNAFGRDIKILHQEIYLEFESLKKIAR